MAHLQRVRAPEAVGAAEDGVVVHRPARPVLYAVAHLRISRHCKSIVEPMYPRSLPA
jgi:hypothetical protein